MRTLLRRESRICLSTPVKIKTNIRIVASTLVENLNKLKDKEVLLRKVSSDVIDLMTKRIHNDGKAADNSPIGDYSNRYLRYRQKKHKRSSDTKIIVSLTRKLENDWAVIATEKGYGIGFLNSLSVQKARWVEDQKGKKIFSLSPEENTYVASYLQDHIPNIINGNV